MRNLWLFLNKHTPWFIYVLCVALSFILIARNMPYQQSLVIGSGNSVVGGVYKLSSGVTQYMHLYTINRELLERNSRLSIELEEVKEQLSQMDSLALLSVAKDSTLLHDYTYREAKVINNSTNRLNNYITLNRGTSHGITPDMGVVDHNGVIGVVTAASSNYAVVIPLLNPKLRVGCKVTTNNYFGALQWSGKDARYANLLEIPSHVEIAVGDTVVTSGYSAIFPAGIVVGTIHHFTLKPNADFYDIEVELASHFGQLHDVQVIENRERHEQHNLEKASQNE